MQSSISLKRMVELSWLRIRTLHCPDIQLMVCYLNSVSGIHFMLQWNPLLGSGSDTALPRCETLTTLILNWHKILYSGLQRKTQGKNGLGEGGCSSGLWDSGPAVTFGKRVFWLYTDVAVNTKVDEPPLEFDNTERDQCTASPCWYCSWSIIIHVAPGTSSQHHVFCTVTALWLGKCTHGRIYPFWAHVVRGSIWTLNLTRTCWSPRHKCEFDWCREHSEPNEGRGVKTSSLWFERDSVSTQGCCRLLTRQSRSPKSPGSLKQF